jgi:hypothetical protein
MAKTPKYDLLLRGGRVADGDVKSGADDRNE